VFFFDEKRTGGGSSKLAPPGALFLAHELVIL